MADLSRLVFDSSVLVSAAIFPKSTPGLALAAALAEGSILLSAPTLCEVTEVLERPKFERYMTADARDVGVYSVKLALHDFRRLAYMEAWMLSNSGRMFVRGGSRPIG